MSESRDDGPPRNSNSGQSRTNGQADDSRPGSGSRSNRGSDPVADFQRWLMRAGARSMANQVADQVKRSLGAEKRRPRRRVGHGHQRAAAQRAARVPVVPHLPGRPRGPHVGPRTGTMLSDASGALAGLAQGAFSAFEQLMKTPEQTPSAERTVVTPPPAAPDRGDAAQ